MTRAVATALAVALAACLPVQPTGDVEPSTGLPGPPPSTTPAVIERVVDGDTVIAEVAGARERVRLLRIDAPEVARDGEPAECLADASTAALEALVPPGTTVRVATDVEVRDRFDRLLAHMWVDEVWVNGAMLRDGMAQVLTIPPNVAYDDEVLAAADAARRDGRGLWAVDAC